MNALWVNHAARAPRRATIPHTRPPADLTLSFPPGSTRKSPGRTLKVAFPVSEMNVTKNGRLGAKAFLVASIVSQACALARYTLLARLLGPEQLGLAATLILTVQFFHSISDSGSDRFLVQDRDGDEPAVQRLVQLVFVSRGVLTSACLVLAGSQIAAFLKAPELGPAFLGLAVYPAIAGLLHLDMRRSQRRSDFRSEAHGLLLGELGGLAATAIAAYLTRDFTAIIYGLVVRSVILVVVSHVSAERPYRIGYSPEYGSRLTSFALPLMLNGLLLFIGSQGDRLVVGGQLGLAALGAYTAALLLILYPAAILMRFSSTIHLPRIAAGRDDVAVRDEACDQLGGQTLLLGVGMAAGFAVVAPWMIVVLYGSKFAQPAMVIALIGALQSTRFMRQWPTVIALAIGRSGNVLINNVIRMLGLPAALAGALTIGGLEGVIIGFAAGEMVALATSMWMLNRAAARKPLQDFDRLVCFILALTCVFGGVATANDTSFWKVIAVTLGSLALTGWIVRREAATINEAVGAARRALRRR